MSVKPLPGSFDRYENYSATIRSVDLTNLTRHLEGRFLTIADACFSDLKQREAVKSLIKQALWDDYEVLQKWMFDQMEGKASSFPF